MSRQKDDHDRSIVHYSKAICLPPVSGVTPSLSIVEPLFYLAYALLERSKKFEQPEDVKYSIEYLRYLQGLPLGSFNVSRNGVTTSLIRALGTQVGAEGGTQNIKEMVILCRELLTSDISADFPIGAFTSLDQTIRVNIPR